MSRPTPHTKAKQLWNKYTPDIQLGGWLIMLCTIVVSAIVLANQAGDAVAKVQDFDSRLSKVENHTSLVDQKLDLVISLLKSEKVKK